MKKFDYAVAINQLGLDKEPINSNIRYELIPEWVRGEDFLRLFLAIYII